MVQEVALEKEVISDNFRLHMADRLQRITDFLNSANHEAAMRAHLDHPTATAPLEPALQLALARTFHFVGGDYRQAADILRRVIDSPSAEIRWEARMLMARTIVLGGGQSAEAFAMLRELGGDGKYHQRCVEEVSRMIELMARTSEANARVPPKEGSLRE